LLGIYTQAGLGVTVYNGSDAGVLSSAGNSATTAGRTVIASSDPASALSLYIAGTTVATAGTAYSSTSSLAITVFSANGQATAALLSGYTIGTGLTQAQAESLDSCFASLNSALNRA
jgi:hypothetical protein